MNNTTSPRDIVYDFAETLGQLNMPILDERLLPHSKGRALLLSLALSATTVSAVYSQTDAKPDELMQRLPTLQKNGKTVVVSPDEYIKHHLADATTKYKLIAVPDG